MTEAGDQGATTTIRATAIARDGRAALLMGPSGSGKSSLALRLAALGGRLVSDDMVHVRRRDQVLIASCPRPELVGKIEARGVGIIDIPHVPQAEIVLAVELTKGHGARHPDPRTFELLGLTVTLYSGEVSSHFCVTLHHLLAGKPA
ncbi:HPr kinase/phosphorylase [Tropicimonas sp. IMCC34011]|uniref:HPr kinase/phosphorylase n=1 Tax=Tropicimonas sp. IMCC34011 TaxID=2248759 RepID=UPI000E24A8AF|nr:HPr kinase/phosphatase C-terminal domain-containing protein [Tropicimonas sp. IMCC34011]